MVSVIDWGFGCDMRLKLMSWILGVCLFVVSDCVRPVVWMSKARCMRRHQETTAACRHRVLTT